MGKLKSNEQFITDAENTHKDEHGNPIYLYYKTGYINAKTKVVITCRKHGDFSQIPDNHLNGAKCPKCSIEKVAFMNTYTNKEFIRRARLVHGDKYDYSKVKYINSRTKVIIICPEHGEFEQTPENHLQGKGCNKCGIISTKNKLVKSKKEFIKQSKLIHCDVNNIPIYNYSYMGDYINAKTPIKILCQLHGFFKTTPDVHLKGAGCPKCNSSKGETKIANYLDQHKIPYIREYKIDGYRYRYDFYLEGYNLLIEFHGIQHYEPVSHWNKNKGFKKQQRNDKAKIELAKRNGIDLLVISYLELDQIEEILKYELVDKVKNTKIVDISHVYELYCTIDKKEKRRLIRYQHVLYSYLTGKDLYAELSRYKKLSININIIIEILDTNISKYKSKFIRLLVIKNKILIRSNKC